MRNSSITLTTAVALAAFLAGCSGGSQSMPSAVPGGNGMQSQAQSMLAVERSGIAPQAQYRAPASQLNANPNTISLGVKTWAVSAAGYGEDVVLNNAGQQTAIIKNRLTGPDGNWFDSKGDLYVADFDNSWVAEYNPGQTGAAFIYSAGISNGAVVATTDSNLNVYAGSYSGGTVTEYAHRVNAVKFQCSPGGNVDGIAVDSSGDVFVSYNTSGGKLAEYKGGLSGCTKTALTPTLSFAGGLILDKNGNLLACDQTSSAIRVIPPPYTTITKSLSGFSDPFRIALNTQQNLLFVADPGYYYVWVKYYPSGNSYATYSFYEPLGVATY